MSTLRTGFTGDVNAYTFPLRGRFINLAPVNTQLPTDVIPYDESNVPSPWVYLGPTENQIVNITLSTQTEAIVTGVIPTERKKYITGQSGLLEANLFRYEPGIIALANGADLDAITPASGVSRAFRDLWLGGKLGAKQAVWVLEDYDENLKEDKIVAPAVAEAEYEQTWYFNPNSQKDGDVNVSTDVTKTPVVPIRLALFGFNQGGYNRLLQVRFVAKA